MALVLKCTCGKLLDMDEQHHGERGQCPWCGNQFIVGELIHSTTAVQDELSPPRVVRDFAAAPEQRDRPCDRLPEPRIAYSKPMPLFVWFLVFAFVFVFAPASIYFLLGTSEDGYGKIDQALATIKGTLTVACECYQLQHGQYPKNLEALLQRDHLGGPYIKSPEFLVDPWGRPYRYDPAGPRNNGMIPDISFVAPNGNEIGNWPKGR